MYILIASHLFITYFLILLQDTYAFLFQLETQTYKQNLQKFIYK